MAFFLVTFGKWMVEESVTMRDSGEDGDCLASIWTGDSDHLQLDIVLPWMQEGCPNT